MSFDTKIIVFGNEKGGSGKSTAAMHTAIGLMRLGYRVGTIDLDARQGTLTRYLANRFTTAREKGLELPSPVHFPIERSRAESKNQQEMEDRNFLSMAIEEMAKNTHYIVIDTPGTESYLSTLAHSYADFIITPMNDSYVDLDLIARLDGQSGLIKGPSVYTKMVQAARKHDAVKWVVLRNRITGGKNTHESHKNLWQTLCELAPQYGFTALSGFSESPIYRDLFPKGLTLLDIKQEDKQNMTLAALAARQEIRLLLREIVPAGLPPKNM